MQLRLKGSKGVVLCLSIRKAAEIRLTNLDNIQEAREAAVETVNGRQRGGVERSNKN